MLCVTTLFAWCSGCSPRKTHVEVTCKTIPHPDKGPSARMRIEIAIALAGAFLTLQETRCVGVIVTAEEVHQDAPYLAGRQIGHASQVVNWWTRAAMAGRDLWYLGAPGARYAVSIGVVSSSAMALYYNRYRPRPTQCQPPAVDKWQHCFVGCEISARGPVGALAASALAVLKEVRDNLHGGEFSWPDIKATLRGIWDCPIWTPCESFCCREFG